MSDERLRELLRATAEPVEPPSFAAAAWAEAERRTRRHRIAAVTATAATVCAVALVVALTAPYASGRRAQPAASATTGPVSLSAAPVSIAPVPGDEGAAPLAASALPAVIDTDPAHALPLSTHPVRRALAVVAPYPKGWPGVLPRHVTVLVLGDDGRTRRIDTTTILGTLDGYAPAPVGPTTLSEDGTMVAFPQPDYSVLTVDLRTGRTHRYGLDAAPVAAGWIDDDSRLTVAFSHDSGVIDRSTGALTHRRYGDVAAPGEAPGPDDVTLSQPRVDDSVPARVGTYDRTDGQPLTSAWVDGPPANGNWYGTGFTSAGKVVRATAGPMRTYGLKVGATVDNEVSVVRVSDGSLARVLALPDVPDGAQYDRRYKACCSVLGWPSGNAVLVDSHAMIHRVLVWNTRTGKVWRLTSLSGDAQVAITNRLMLSADAVR